MLERETASSVQDTFQGLHLTISAPRQLTRVKILELSAGKGGWGAEARRHG